MTWASKLTLVGALVAAACTGPGARDRSVLVAAVDGDPGQLNPAITTNGGVHTVADILYNGLVGLDEDQQPVPELAVRWEVEDSGRVYRFHLRRGVRWHDGKPFGSADVKFTFDEMLLRFHARTRASLGPVLTSIETPDDSTVEFRFRRPYAPLLQQLNVVEAPILPRHIYQGTDPLRNPANQAPVGTGPFRFSAYAPDAEIRYARNDQYFDGAPAFKSLILRVIPEAVTQVLALEAGAVDWLFSVPAPQRQRLRRNPAVTLLQTSTNPGGSNCISTLAFNLDRPLLRDIRMRRAVAHSLDRERLLTSVLFGEGAVARAPISSKIGFAHAPGLALPDYDTAAAAGLFDAAGYPRNKSGGRGLVVGLKQLASFAGYGDLIRAELRAQGIDLRIETLEQALFVKSVFEQRNFDMALISYCNGTDPQIGVLRQYASSSIGPVPFSNAAGYRDPVMDSLFDVAGAVLDRDGRRRIYRTIQENAVRDLPYIWLVETVSTRAHRARCTNFGSSPHFAAKARCR